jgi:hypothetical protein
VCALMARTLKEKVIDRLLSLYVVNRCQTKHGIEYVSETKLQKLIFYAEKKLHEKNYKAFNYRFIKLLYPTYSEELRNDLAILTDHKILDGPYFSESKKANMIVRDFSDVFAKNRRIMDVIDSQVDKKAPIRTPRLVRNTNRLRWRNGTIKDLQNGTPLIYPLNANEATCSFEVDEEDLEDLAICLGLKVTEGMEKAFGELRRGRRLKHAEVFG